MLYMLVLLLFVWRLYYGGVGIGMEAVKTNILIILSFYISSGQMERDESNSNEVNFSQVAKLSDVAESKPRAQLGRPEPFDHKASFVVGGDDSSEDGSEVERENKHTQTESGQSEYQVLELLKPPVPPRSLEQCVAIMKSEVCCYVVWVWNSCLWSEGAS